MNIRRKLILCFAIVLPYTTAECQAPAPTQPDQNIAPVQSQGLDAILAPEEEKNKTDIQVESPKTTTEEKDIYLNFDNAELSSFINYIGEIKKLNLITDKSIEGTKISLTIRKPLSVEGAWNVFLTVLEMAGFSIINTDEVYKIIPKAQKRQQPLPAYINITADKIPDNDSNIRYVLFLANLQAPDMVELTKSMLSAEGDALPVKEVNGLIITDKCYNIKTAVKVLQELDQMGTAETVSVVHLKSANANDAKTLLESLIKQPEVSPIARLMGKTAEGGSQFFAASTRIIAEPRTNTLILLGSPKPIKVIEDFIKDHIDTELKEAKSPLHVYDLQNTEATQIAEILREVTAPADSEAGNAASKFGSVRNGVKYFKKMTFQVDKDGNRLIVSSSDKVDWKLLEQTIKDLDKPQPQVAIECLIAMVTVDDNKAIGGNMRLKKPDQVGTNIGFQSAASNSSGPSVVTNSASSAPVSLLGNMMSQLSYQQGLTALTFGNPGTTGGGVWGVFSMLKKISNTTILSQPFVTAVNKTTSTIDVGTEIRVQQATSGSSTGFEPYKGNYTLNFTPQINLDGLIRMRIDASLDDITSNDPANPESTKRKLVTNATVADGQVLVLGGFVQTKVTETVIKTPFLGDLPLLGWFFKNQAREVKKNYLFIFMCPTIIKPRTQPGIGLYSSMKLHDVTDCIEDSIPTKKLPDPIHNWFFDAGKENYSHKVIDFANARYQPTTVDIKNDDYYRTVLSASKQEEKERKKAAKEKNKQAVEQAPLIQGSPPTSPQITQIDPGKRTQLKDLISTTPAGEELNVDAEKRNTIKEFLSHGEVTS